MRRRWWRWYARFGIEQPFPWLLCALLPVVAVCALIEAVRRAE